MNQPSLTGSESFQFRIQRSEVARAVFMAGVYTLMILLTVGRRLAGGVVMTDNDVFVPYTAALAAGLAYECFAACALRRSLRRNRLIAQWRLTAGAIFELAVATMVLTAVHFWSPRGAYVGLSGPALLLFPLTILLSALRLKPVVTLWTGITAALIHAALAADTIRIEHIEPNLYPVLFSYAVLFALMGVASSLVSRAARRYVAEAAEEAAAREQGRLKLAAVERDLEVARDIQRGLMPAGPPGFDGFDIAGMNTPADQTGGDYYDWQPLPNGRLLVVMADVTGHGIGPALVMAVCRAYARASAPMDMVPESLMARLNALLHADMSDAGRFITLAMAALATDGRVELVSAGHGPTMLFRAASKTIDEFGGDGLPLAIADGENYGPARTFTMQHGDLLVMLTDGVMEWQNAAGRQFGAERIAKCLTEAASRSAAQIVEHLHQSVVAFAAGARQNDDVTIVVIKRSA